MKSISVAPPSSTYEQTFSGQLQSQQETDLSFKVSGTIERIFVQVGDRIEVGDVIAELDATTYELVAQQANATLAQNNSTERNALANYERIKNLYENGNASRDDLDDARTEAESAQANRESAEKELEIALLDVEYTKLVAENDCSISDVLNEEGENVQNGTTVAQASCGDELEVDLDIPEGIIAGISKGMSVSMIFPAAGNRAFSGEVIEVGITSTQGGTTFPVTVLLSDESVAGLRSGMSSEVTFLLDRGESAFMLPSFAVSEDNAGTFVYKVVTSEEGSSKVERSPVTIGVLSNAGIEILSGVEAGDQIVTAGVSVLRDGMEVKTEI
ncbi:MAG: efflux RND transporter periplasmic adaptor subunit [Verrucomicrobiota bacterium]